MTKRDYKVASVEQIRLLRPTIRQEIMDTVIALGECSLREVAEQIGRPADGLYYHVRALVEGGLLVPAGHRETGHRPEAVFRAPTTGIMRMRYRPGDEAHSDAVRGVVASMLRTAERDFSEGLDPDLARGAGPTRNLNASRQKAWLGAEDLREVNRLLARLQQIFAGETFGGITGGEAELCSLTFVLAPIEFRPPRREA